MCAARRIGARTNSYFVPEYEGVSWRLRGIVVSCEGVINIRPIGGTRQQDCEGRAGADCAGDRDLAAGLRYDAIAYRQPQAGPLLRRFGGKEWLE